MPLATRQGPPGPNLPAPDTVTPQTKVDMQSALDQVPYIKDSFVNRTAFNPETYADEFKLLQRYILGSRIKVTYFLVSTPTGGLQRSTDIDRSTIRSAIKTSYTQINEFEIVMQGPIHNTFDQESKETKVFGEALLYPGMHPRMGDLFVTPIGDATYGIFRVTSIERLSYRQGANHKITFFLDSRASDEYIDIIKQSVTEELWFDKDTYLGDTTTLLKSDSYRHLKTLKQMRNILIRYYYNTFYDKKMSSIMSPEGIYDPYLVNYLNGKISIEDSIYRPTQLYVNFQNYENTLWSRLNDVTNRKLVNIQANYNYIMYRVNRWDDFITSLVNRTMIGIGNPNREAMSPGESEEFIPLQRLGTDYPDPPPGGLFAPAFTPGPGPLYPPASPYPPPSNNLLPNQNTVPFRDNAFGSQDPLLYISTQAGYVLSTNFYTANYTAMTPLELLVYAAIYDRNIEDIGSFIDIYLNRYSSLSFDDQYYFIPLYLWLIDVALNQIQAPNSFMT